MPVHFKDVRETFHLSAFCQWYTNLNAQQTLNEVISNHSANTLLYLKGHLYLHLHLGSLKIILHLSFITFTPSVTCFSVRLFADLKDSMSLLSPKQDYKLFHSLFVGKLMSTVSVRYDTIRYDMIFINCNRVSTQWQWSVKLYTKRK